MTKLNKALFICEAGSSVGFGHFMRCLALNEELTSRGWKCKFAMDRESLCQPLVKNHIETAFVLPEGINTDPAEIIKLHPKGFDWLFIDHYEIKKGRINELRGWARGIAWFQDMEVVVMKMVGVLIEMAPYGVFALLTKLFATMGFGTIFDLAAYFFALLGVLLFHGLVV